MPVVSVTERFEKLGQGQFLGNLRGTDKKELEPKQVPLVRTNKKAAAHYFALRPTYRFTS